MTKYIYYVKSITGNNYVNINIEKAKKHVQESGILEPNDKIIYIPVVSGDSHLEIIREDSFNEVLYD